MEIEAMLEKTDPKQLEAFRLARGNVGLSETKGPEHTAEIVRMFADVGHSWVKDDETAWCAAFMGSMLKRAGLPHTGKLNARSYLDWGEPVSVDEAKEGDVVVFMRGDSSGWQGHVGFFVKSGQHAIWTLGGNQKNRVGIDPYSIHRVLGVRRMTVKRRPGLIDVLVAILRGRR